jgi:hypothetical protein
VSRVRKQIIKLMTGNGWLRKEQVSAILKNASWKLDLVGEMRGSEVFWLYRLLIKCSVQ